MARDGRGRRQSSAGRTVEALERRRLLAVQPVADLPPGTKDSNPHSFFEFNGQVLFAATGPQGTELWRTDGTPGGTQLVRDISPSGSSNPDHFIRFGDAVYFTADDGAHGVQLWKTDGTTAGTVAVNPTGPANLLSLTVADGRLFFLAGNGISESLWSTDGTAAGTVAVANANNVSAGAGIVGAGPFVYFVNRDSTSGAELWKTDAAGSPATLVADIRPGAGDSNPQSLTALGGTLLFTADDGSGRELWTTDGTAPPLQLTALTEGDASRSPAQLTTVGNAAFFVAGNDPSGLALWQTDGTAAGTQVVRGLVPDLGTGAPTQLTAADGQLFFVFNGSGTGTELWKSDGTFDGTALVKDLTPGPAGTNFYSLQAVGNLLYFNANGWYRTDGTDAGTVADNRAYPPGAPRTANGQVIYAGTDPVFGVEPFGTDDTPAGTGMLADINTAARSLSVGNFTRAGAYTYFSAVTPQGTYGLWRTDGTTTGTICLSNGTGAPAIHEGGEGPGGKLFYTGSFNGDFWLWTSDGTVAGTTAVAQIRQPNYEPYIWPVVRVGNLVYFAGDSPNGYYNSVWRSDGTAAGTYRLPVVWTDNFNGYYGFPLGNYFYFTAPASDGHGQLWRTDGTVAGTGVFLDNQPLSPFGTGIQLVAANASTIFFNDYGYQSENALWRTDGTQAGTFELLHQPAGAATIFQGQLYDLAQDHLYKSDGTVAGTVSIASPGTGPYNLGSYMQVAGNLLFFTAGYPDSSQPANYLWRSDGTAAGTSMLQPGGTPVSTGPLTPAGSLVYFGSTGGLWRSDGTDAGTILDTPSGSPVLYSPGAAVHNSAGDSLVGYRSDASTGGNSLVRFGPAALGSITGRVFDDVNHNGIFDAGDQPLPGREVYLDLNANGLLDPTDIPAYADSMGNYSFPALLPGTYSLRQVLPTGRTQTDPSTAAASVVVTNQPVTGINFGSASLRPRANPGGPYTATPGAQVTLDGTASFSLSGTITTYEWDFNFDLTLPFTVDATGAHPVIPAGAAPGTRTIALRVTDSSGQVSAIVSTTVTVAAASGSISGGVFNDANDNALRDPAEAARAGVTVYLDTNGNGVPDPGEPTAVSDAAGTYRFANLLPGTYVVRQVLPGGWARTTPLAASATVELAAGQVATGPTFGDVQISTVPMDFNYLLTLAQHYGQQGTFATGDLNADDQVNFNDLLLLAQNYGHTLPAAAAMPLDGPSADLLKVRGQRR